MLVTMRWWIEAVIIVAAIGLAIMGIIDMSSRIHVRNVDAYVKAGLVKCYPFGEGYAQWVAPVSCQGQK